MVLYIVWALLKVLIWSFILIYTFGHIDPFADSYYAILFFILGFVLISWWTVFLLVLVINRVFLWKWLLSYSYRISFFIVAFFAINLVLMFFDLWSKLIWIVLLMVFLIFLYFASKYND